MNGLLTFTYRQPTDRHDANFLKTWHVFIDPARRPKRMQAMVFYVPGETGAIVHLGPTGHVKFPDAITFVAVDLMRIVRTLEKATGDQWLPPTAEYGPRPPRRRGT